MKQFTVIPVETHLDEIMMNDYINTIKIIDNSENVGHNVGPNRRIFSISPGIKLILLMLRPHYIKSD